MKIRRVPILSLILTAVLLLPGWVPGAVSDDSIKKGVERALQDFPPTSNSDISVESSEGVVTLSGETDNLPLKNLAADVAGTIRGVRAIVNHLTVKEVERDDEAIASDIGRIFALNPHLAKDEVVNYRVNDGVVTLNGTVSSNALKRLAEESASSLVGVRSVLNQLRVSFATQPDDKEISQHIALALRHNPWVEDELVKITVKNGKVSIHGTVDSFSERTRLLSAVDVNGVIDIESEQLTVSPELKPRMERPHRPFFTSDSELKQALIDAYYRDPRLTRADVYIEVQDGVVTLTGAVDSIGSKAAAEQIAGDIPGGGEVYSFLTIDTESSPSPSQMETALNLYYQSDSVLSEAEIDVEVKDHTVSLSGMVETPYHRRRAVKIASSMEGVKKVESGGLRINWETPEAYKDSASNTANQ